MKITKEIFKFTLEELNNLEILILDKENSTHFIANNLKEYLHKELSNTKKTKYELLMTSDVFEYLASSIDEQLTSNPQNTDKLYPILESLVKQERKYGLVSEIQSDAIKPFFI